MDSESCVPYEKVGTLKDSLRPELNMPSKHVVVDQRFAFANDGSVSKVRLFAGSTSGDGYEVAKLKVRCLTIIRHLYYNANFLY